MSESGAGGGKEGAGGQEGGGPIIFRLFSSLFLSPRVSKRDSKIVEEWGKRSTTKETGVTY